MTCDPTTRRDPVEAFRALDAALSRMMALVAQDRHRPEGIDPNARELLAFVDAGEQAVDAWADLTVSEAAEEIEAGLSATYGGTP